MRARAELVVPAEGQASGGVGLRWRSDPPVALRPTGPDRVHLVQAAGGPLGGDELALDIHLGPGASLLVRSAAAMVAQPGHPPAVARWTVTASLGTGALLDWRPEPTVVCDEAELHSSMRVALDRGAGVVLREEVVLGRAGQRGGRFRGELDVTREGTPLLVHTMLLDGSDPVLSGPAGTAGARVVGMLAAVGDGLTGAMPSAGEHPGLRWACSPLDGPGWLLLALGAQAAQLGRFLDRTLDTLGWAQRPIRSLSGTLEQGAFQDGDCVSGEMNPVTGHGGAHPATPRGGLPAGEQHPLQPP